MGMFRTETVRIDSLRKGDSFVRTVTRYEGLTVWEVFNVAEVLGNDVRLVVGTSNDGIASSRSVTLPGSMTVPKLLLNRKTQTMLDAFRAAAAAAGVV